MSPTLRRSARLMAPLVAHQYSLPAAVPKSAAGKRATSAKRDTPAKKAVQQQKKTLKNKAATPAKGRVAKKAALAGASRRAAGKKAVAANGDDDEEMGEEELVAAAPVVEDEEMGEAEETKRPVLAARGPRAKRACEDVEMAGAEPVGRMTRARTRKAAEMEGESAGEPAVIEGPIAKKQKVPAVAKRGGRGRGGRGARGGRGGYGSSNHGRKATPVGVTPAAIPEKVEEGGNADGGCGSRGSHDCQATPGEASSPPPSPILPPRLAPCQSPAASVSSGLSSPPSQSSPPPGLSLPAPGMSFPAPGFSLLSPGPASSPPRRVSSPLAGFSSPGPVSLSPRRISSPLAGPPSSSPGSSPPRRVSSSLSGSSSPGPVFASPRRVPSSPIGRSPVGAGSLSSPPVSSPLAAMSSPAPSSAPSVLSPASPTLPTLARVGTPDKRGKKTGSLLQSVLKKAEAMVSAPVTPKETATGDHSLFGTSPVDEHSLFGTSPSELPSIGTQRLMAALDRKYPVGSPASSSAGGTPDRSMLELNSMEFSDDDEGCSEEGSDGGYLPSSSPAKAIGGAAEEEEEEAAGSSSSVQSGTDSFDLSWERGIATERALSHPTLPASVSSPLGSPLPSSQDSFELSFARGLAAERDAERDGAEESEWSIGRALDRALAEEEEEEEGEEEPSDAPEGEMLPEHLRTQHPEAGSKEEGRGRDDPAMDKALAEQEEEKQALMEELVMEKLVRGEEEYQTPANMLEDFRCSSPPNIWGGDANPEQPNTTDHPRPPSPSKRVMHWFGTIFGGGSVAGGTVSTPARRRVSEIAPRPYRSPVPARRKTTGGALFVRPPAERGSYLTATHAHLRADAATKIQCLFRSWVCRRRYLAEKNAAQVIQRAWRARRERKKRTGVPEEVEDFFGAFLARHEAKKKAGDVKTFLKPVSSFTKKLQGQEQVAAPVPKKVKAKPTLESGRKERAKSPLESGRKERVKKSVSMLPKRVVLKPAVTLAQPKPELRFMTPAEVVKLTHGSTIANRLYNCTFDKEVVRIDRPRPSSPTPKTQHTKAVEQRKKRKMVEEDTGVVLGAGDDLDFQPRVLTPSSKRVRWGSKLEHGYDSEPEKNSPTSARNATVGKGIVKNRPELDQLGNLVHPPPMPESINVLITKVKYRNED